MNVDTVLVIGCLFISTLVKDTHSLTLSDRQSDIVDYRAAYFAAKNHVSQEIILS